MKIGRNDPCPCGSGRKYKHCCLRKDEAHRIRETSNAEGIADFEGLSPDQMHRLLYGGIEDIRDVVTVARSVPDELALTAPIAEVSRWILGYLVEKGNEIKLTQRGNLPKAMCERFLRHYALRWPGGSVPQERRMPRLADAHDISEAYGLIEEDARRVWVSNEGARLYASGRWGAVFPSILRFAIEESNWLTLLPEAWETEHVRFVQVAAMYIMRLLARHPEGSEYDLIDRFGRAFPRFIEPASDSEAVMVRLRDCLWLMAIDGIAEPFGLVTTHHVTADEEGQRSSRYRTTELFHATFRWHA